MQVGPLVRESTLHDPTHVNSAPNPQPLTPNSSTKAFDCKPCTLKPLIRKPKNPTEMFLRLWDQRNPAGPPDEDSPNRCCLVGTYSMEPACEHRAVALVSRSAISKTASSRRPAFSGAAWAIVRVGLLWVQGLGFRVV